MLLRRKLTLLSTDLNAAKSVFFSMRWFSGGSPVSSAESRNDLMSKHLPKRKPITGVKKVLIIASGKGGVGKSTVAVNLAIALKKLEPQKEVGLLDADVFGPSIPLMMNVNETPLLTDDDRMKPLVNYGVKFMSMGNLITETSAAMWRGLMVMNALDKLIRQVAWEPLDYMIIDTPPGTGDTHLSLFQNIPITGTVIVSTGQKASLQVTRRGITMFEKLKTPIVGLIHNMSYIQCSNCSKRTSMFGDHLPEFLKNTNIEILGDIPFDSSISSGGDEGIPVVISHPSSLQGQAFFSAASKISAYLKSK